MWGRRGGSLCESGILRLFSRHFQMYILTIHKYFGEKTMSMAIPNGYLRINSDTFRIRIKK